MCVEEIWLPGDIVASVCITEADWRGRVLGSEGGGSRRKNKGEID